MEPLKTGEFFTKFYAPINGKLLADELVKFEQASTDEQRFAYIMNLVEAKLSVDELNGIFRKRDSGKLIRNIHVALELKKSGNEMFQKNDWDKALEYYTKSYLQTPTANTNEISIILANRSAALYHLNRFDKALADIELAIPNYPKDMLYKLKERQARCHLGKKDLQKALEKFKETITYLDESKLIYEKRCKIETDSQIMIKLLISQIERDESLKKGGQKKSPKSKTIVNLTDDGLNRSVTFDYNELEGRYAKARQSIKIGERILTEQPHCSMMLEPYSANHCQHCFIDCWSIAITCSNCTDVVFCSAKCRAEAMETYHRYECGLLPILWQSGSSINCHMALRIMAQKSMDYFINLKEELLDETIDQSTKLPITDYRKVYNLVRHEKKRSSKNFMQYTLMAYYLTKCLNLSDFFNQSTDPNHFIYIGSLILRNLQFLQFNTHEIFELDDRSSNQKTVFIGGGLYPTLALFNHSCDPSLVRFFRGTKVYTVAIKNIGSGEMISENYGPLYTQQAINDRQDQLKEQYWFDCQCEACVQNWKLYKDMTNDEIRFKCDDGESGILCKNVITVPINCTEFMIKCIECGKFTNILKGLKAVQDTDILDKTAKRLYDSGDTDKALEKYYEMFTIMDSVLAPPFRDYCNCQQQIRECLLRYGNKTTGI